MADAASPDAPAPTHADCPPRPAKDTPDALGFARRPMVRWFTPAELVRAGVKALLSSLFGAYADRREIQALQAAQALISEEGAGEDIAADPVRPEIYDLSDRADCWIDYVADLGDGWDATYTVARLLAAETLAFADGDTRHATARGDVLVMGGDQVYPTATREAYNDRLVGPYRAALPCVPDGDRAPRLFAVPGNHDWYDGLTSFLRLFCQGRWIGGWKTVQRRSYFAVKLPHDWWLWGLDVQLSSDIDRPQRDYFEAIARDRMPPGSKVILCTAEPSWVYARQKGEEAFQNLAYFERKIIRAYGHEHVVGLAGDLHAYARYEEQPTASDDRPPERRKQRFIAGGGGAYLYPTHQLPEALTLQSGDEQSKETYALGTGHEKGDAGRSVFPDASASRRRAWGALALPFHNVQFAGLLGALYLFFMWLVQSGSRPGITFIDRLRGLSLLEVGDWGTAFATLGAVLTQSPGSMLLALVVVGGLIGFADLSGWRRVLVGGLHGLAHVATALVTTWACVLLHPMAGGSARYLVVLGGGILVLGSVVGGVVMGSYLLLTNRLLRTDTGLRGVHANEAFSCQSIPDYKHFLRLHLDADGALHIYPIGVDRVPRTWTWTPEAPLDAPWFEPDEGPLDARTCLIEPPIHLPAVEDGARSA